MLFRIVLIICFISCQNNPQSITIKQDGAFDKMSTYDVKTACDRDYKITTLIQSAIDIPAVQQYFNVQKTISQPDFIIEKNRFISDDMVLSKFTSRVKLLSEDEIKHKKYQAYIRFEKVSIISDTADIYFEYPIQGLGCEATFVNSKSIDGTCQWKLLRNKLFEYKII